VLMLVELEAILGRSEVEAFVQFLSHAPSPWSFFPPPLGEG
jgi:hypothetical protein